jgi:hypothetical protein
MKDEHVAVLLEDIDSKLVILVDGQKVLSEEVERIDTRLQRLETQTELIPAFRLAVTQEPQDLKDHQIRIATLEQAA